jgi:predicted negative regulator of RcsB-dependent stress response
MGRRITRKQLKQDEFVSTVDTLIHWLSGYWRPVVAGLGAAMVVTLLWWIGTSWSSSRADQASYLLYQAVQSYSDQLGGTEPASDTDEPELKLGEVIDRFGRSDQADVARVYRARIHIERGELEEARDLLVEVVDRHPSDAVGRVATLDLVHLRVASGQGAEVAQELQAMVVGSDPRLPRDTALFELGELFTHQQDLEHAQEYFQKLVDEFPESPYLGRARQRLSELG